MTTMLTTLNSRAQVVVGLDFGTTFSGFAYARTAEPEKLHTYFDWPDMGAAGGKQYCKTMTSLLYEDGECPGSYVLRDWGYSALLKLARGVKPQKKQKDQEENPATRRVSDDAISRVASYFITKFKLHLAASDDGITSAEDLPEGLTPTRVISDYLRKLTELVMVSLHSNLGSHITKEDIQWCLTVPAMWDEGAKQDMKVCSEMAGMVTGPRCEDDCASPHPLIIVLEPEAASLYCQKKLSTSNRSTLQTGDKFLVVDVGGGTVDLVLHEKVAPSPSLNVREVSPSSGGLCGGSYVDVGFYKFLSHKIPCFQEFAAEYPESVLKLNGWWETIKYVFDRGMSTPYDLELPARLARAWEDYSKQEVADVKRCHDAIDLSLEDMRGIFDPVVDKVLQLIEEKMISNLKILMVVGGFSGSPYLVKRIRETFEERVGSIVVPPEPGSAICCGAVLYGIYGADMILSRMSKRTYGIATTRAFYSTDPAHMMFQTEDGESYCRNVFHIFTKKGDEVPLDHVERHSFVPLTFVKGDEVPLDHVERHSFVPLTRNQTQTSITLYSTYASDPKYVSDEGVREEGSFWITHPSLNELGKTPEFLVSLYFGRTIIEVEAKGINFGNQEKFTMNIPVVFEKSFK